MHQPTERVILILEYISKGKGKRLSELSEDLNIPKSTLLPILTTLCDYRYIYRDGDLYYPDIALVALGGGLTGADDVMRSLHRELTCLSRVLGETCYLGVEENGYVRYLDRVDSENPLRVLTAIGTRMPAYATGIGKALLMGKSEEELFVIYPSGLTPITENTLTSISDLFGQLEEALGNGYASEVEESTKHIRCFAVPLQRRGETIAAISVAIPVFRYSEENRESIVGTLRSAAERLCNILEVVDELPYVLRRRI